MSQLDTVKSLISERVDHILVATKYRFIGDTLLAVPLLRAIHEQWPLAKVSLVTGAKACEALMHCPYLDELIEFDPYRPSDKGVRNYLRLVSKLRRRRFDLAFVCNRSFHSALTAALAGAKVRVGWSGFEGRDFLFTCTATYDADAAEVASYLDLFRRIVPNSSPSKDLELWVDGQEREHVRRKLPSSNLIVGIQPGATHAEKQWPVEKFCELAIQILREYPASSFVLIGGPDETAQAMSFLDRCSAVVAERTVNLTGSLSLRETLALLTYLQIFIAGDTAIRHCSMALGTPSIALFGPTSVRKWGNEERPKHVAIAALDNEVASINVDEVFAACSAALALRHSRMQSETGQRARVQV